MQIRSIEDVKIGLEVQEKFSFSRDDIKAFAELATDPAPIHQNTAFAKEQGYRDCLVFGFLVASKFSGLLGSRLPGAYTVLQTVQWKNLKPVYVGETLTYTVRVKQVAASVGAVVLDLRVDNDQGETVLTGVSQCGFRK